MFIRLKLKLRQLSVNKIVWKKFIRVFMFSIITVSASAFFVILTLKAYFSFVQLCIIVTSRTFKEVYLKLKLLVAIKCTDSKSFVTFWLLKDQILDFFCTDYK
jgi:hypothetical protein